MSSAVPRAQRERYQELSRSELIERLFIAEEVCWTVLVMMEMNMIPAQALTEGARQVLATPTQCWGERNQAFLDDVLPAADDPAA